MPRPRLFTASATAATVAAAAAVATVVSVASPAVASAAPGLSAPGRTQVSVDGTWTGLHVGTPNENEARYSLSLTKLLIADYVFEHGGAQDREKARNMVRYSDDNLATELSQKYPQAIPSKVEQYGMTSVDPATARAIADSITAAGEPVVAAVPETIPLPGVIAAALPGARA